MNREQFLSRLKAGLAPLPPKEIEEIISDYVEHFDSAQSAGRSEEELASTLGDPDALAKNLIAEAGVTSLAPGTAHLTKGLVAGVPILAAAFMALIYFADRRSENSNQVASPARTQAFSGNQMRIAFPGTLHYRPDGPRQIMVTGPAQLTSLIRIGGGEVTFSGPQGTAYDDRLAVLISGMPINNFSIVGNGHLSLENIKQETLSVDLKGHSAMVGSGRLGLLTLHISGNSTALLSGLAPQRIAVSIEGQSVATLAPGKEITGTVRGKGKLYLKTQPSLQNVLVSGSGQILK